MAGMATGERIWCLDEPVQAALGVTYSCAHALPIVSPTHALRDPSVHSRPAPPAQSSAQWNNKSATSHRALPPCRGEGWAVLTIVQPSNWTDWQPAGHAKTRDTTRWECDFCIHFMVYFTRPENFKAFMESVTVVQ